MTMILTTDKDIYDVDTVDGAYKYLISETGLSSSDLILIEKLYMQIKLLKHGLHLSNKNLTRKQLKELEQEADELIK